MRSRQRVVAFGELLLRLDAPPPCRLVQAEELCARYTGAEANAAVMLAGLGVEVSVVSRVPEHEVGQACINALRRHGVDTSYVLRGGGRLGLLYVETGAGARPSRVIYDRAHSSFAEMDPAELDWARILEGAGWLHVSGTAAALGGGALEALRDGLRRSRASGIRTSLDCNYRSALWSRERMREVISTILPDVGVFVGSFGDAALVCGEAAPRAGDPLEAARYHGAKLAELYGIEAAGFSLREERPDGTGSYTGLLWVGGEAFRSREYSSAVVDRIGSGDAFTAGLIWGMLRGESGSRVVELSAAAGCLKLTIPGDFALLSLEEIERLASGASGGILR